MSPSSIASSKSLCLTLALAALTTSTSASSFIQQQRQPSICDTCTSSNDIIESSTTIYKRAIHIPSLSTLESDDSEIVLQNNVSAFYSDEDMIDLPAELAALIESANKSSPAAAPTRDISSKSGVRYYATYTNGQSCTSKSSSEFESWEESFATLDECCDTNFSWDYDSCISEVV